MNSSPSAAFESLAKPASYTPYRSGRFEIAAGIKRLGSDFGNSELDNRVFQIDSQWPQYRQSKLSARRESLSKYHLLADFSPQLEKRASAWLSHRLCAEYPALFTRQDASDGGVELHCRLSGEYLRFSGDGVLLDSRSEIRPPYVSSLDALASQVQEDIAVVWVTPEQQARLVAIHLCFPNHWAPADKIGREFLAVHEPVADFSRIQQAVPGLLTNLVGGGPFVRFAWGLATDNRLNHHPSPPPTIDKATWEGRAFDPKDPQLFVRVERQVLYGLPEINAFLFTIRTYFNDLREASRQDKRMLAAAIESMSPAVLAYKGITPYRDVVVDWLLHGQVAP